MKKNFTWLLLANIFKGFYQWIILIIIVKYYTNKEVAEFTLAYALSAPIFMLTNMQLKSIYIVDHTSAKQNNYFIIRLSTVLLTLFGFILYSYSKSMSYIFIVIILIKSLESIFDMVHGYFQKIEKMDYMSKSLIMQSIISLIIFFIMVNLKFELWMNLLATFFVNLIILGLYDLKIIKYLDQTFISNIFHKIDFNLVKTILSNAIPLGFAVFITSYTTNLPRIEVQKYLGMDQLAYFGAFSYMAIGFFQLLLPLQIILRPKLSKMLHNEKITLFYKYLFYSLFIVVLYTIALYLIFILFGDDIIALAYKYEYSKYLDVLLILFIGQGILYISGLLNIAVQSYQVFRLQVIVSLVVFIVSYLSAPYLLKTFGLIGGSYIVILYGILSLLMYGYILLKKAKYE